MVGIPNLSRSAPPRQARPLPSRRLLVIAPHPDDESLGTGGLILAARAAGGEIKLVFVTDGEAGDFHGAAAAVDFAALRRREAALAAVRLGAGEAVFLGLPDGRLNERRRDLRDRLAAEFEAWKPDLVVVPSGWESHADHRVCAGEALRAFQRWSPPIESGARLAFCEITVPLTPNWLLDVTPWIAAKRAAIEVYASQLAQQDYLGTVESLNRFRSVTLPAGCAAAEAYLVLDCEAARTANPHLLWDEEPGARPLGGAAGAPVSIVVRTRNRPHLLVEALASLRASTYGALEAVVINDGGESVRELVATALGAFPHEVREYTEAGGRAEALNRGLETASGTYVGFLDDDDLVYPEHVEALVGVLAGGRHRVAYSDAAVGIYEAGGENGSPKLRERRLPYSQDFDADLLLFDNYIPLNSLLFERVLFAETGPFDHAFELFEDWDFLIRLSRRAPFFHLRQTTCEYRHIHASGQPAPAGGSGQPAHAGSSGSIAAGAPRGSAEFTQARRAIYAKHRVLRGVEAQARVFDHLRQTEVSQREELKVKGSELQRLDADLRHLEQEQRRLAERYFKAERDFHQANGEREALRGAVAIAHTELLGESERLRRAYAAHEELLQVAHAAQRLAERVPQLETELDRVYAELGRSSALVAAMEGTRAWRWHRRIERWRRKLTGAVDA